MLGAQQKRVSSTWPETLDNPGATERNRTADLLITNQLLYQLSYGGAFGTASGLTGILRRSELVAILCLTVKPGSLPAAANACPDQEACADNSSPSPPVTA